MIKKNTLRHLKSLPDPAIKTLGPCSSGNGAGWFSSSCKNCSLTSVSKNRKKINKVLIFMPKKCSLSFRYFPTIEKTILMNVFINYDRSEKRDVLYLMTIIVSPESVLAWMLSLSRSALSFSRGRGEGSLLSSFKKFLFPAAMRTEHCFTEF